MLNNCVLSGNWADHGGGADYCSLNNCTLTGNSATNFAGGTYSGALTNCILYYNTAPIDANYHNDGEAAFTYCCTTPLPAGLGNVTNEPLFVDTNGWSNLHLQAGSPCINAGNNAYAPGVTDLDGNPRISGSTVDVGAYEFQFPDPFRAWLAQYGLATDGSADFADFDGDGMNNWQEWVAGTNPTNANSVLQLHAPVLRLPGLQLRWSSTSGQSYFVQRTTNLAAPVWLNVGTDIPGAAGTTAYTDTTGPSLSGAFYRVGTGASNSASPPSLQVPAFIPASVVLTWSSVTNRSYALEWATNLSTAPAFFVLQSNIAGLPDEISWTDTNSAGAAPRFYRVRVQQ